MAGRTVPSRCRNFKLTHYRLLLIAIQKALHRSYEVGHLMVALLDHQVGARVLRIQTKRIHKARDEYCRYSRLNSAHGGEKLDARHSGHTVVGDHQIEAVFWK